jgi:hypothetical protein
MDTTRTLVLRLWLNIEHESAYLLVQEVVQRSKT